MELQVNKLVERNVVVRALSEDNKKNRQAEFVISTETPDSYGTVFKISGWDLMRYEKNPVVLYAHKTHSDNPDMVIGTSEVRVDGQELIGTVTFESADINPLAEKVWQKVQAGSLRMASIGADIKSGHWGDDKLGEDRDIIYFDSMELLEWSIVPVGSNSDALKRESQTMEELRKAKPSNKDNGEVPTEKRTVREAQLIINQNNS
jgi:HK97 family phage prohead protease